MLAPAIAWQTTSRGLPARTKLLTIAGVDVAAPVATGNGLGVDVRSVKVTEAAAGNVSSLEFTVTDPSSALSVNQMDPVVFWDIALDLPVFVGWAQQAPAHPIGTGREITVTCIGIEAILDWAYVPSFTIPIGTDAITAYQMICAAAVGLNGTPLRWAADFAGFGGSTVQYPIDAQNASAFPLLSAYVVAAGTLRQALRTFAEWWPNGTNRAQGGTDGHAVWISVDFWGGVRIWEYTPAALAASWLGGPQDYAAPTTIAIAGPARPSGTEYATDGGSTPRTAVVTAGAAVTTVSDGTGLPGPTVTRNDANATTVAQRAGIGAAMLAGQGGGITGSTTAEGTLTLGTFVNQVRPGGSLSMQDPQAGIASPLFTWMGAISKTFAPSGEETWRIDFGSKRARGATGLLRRLAQGELA